ncbi:MAG: transglutaminase-like domain-containing protein [Proteobacteria bacterium]|nr:transglutaminase-like domain-containing protein [Pseudomonadota bacterium]
MDNNADSKYLKPTAIIDSDHDEIIQYAHQISGSGKRPAEKAVSLFYAVRDDIRYDPYHPFYRPEHYRASAVLKCKKGFCVCKASLLCALGRTVGIPSRVGFADVRNHLATRQLVELLGSNLFVYHGFVEFYLDGKWVKATPTFNKELCSRHHVPPLDFNGRDDSVFQSFNDDKKKFMEYVRFHGTYDDIPIDTIIAAWENTYGKDRVRDWIHAYEKLSEKDKPDFYKEDIITD